MNSLSAEEVETLVSLLNKCEPGNLPDPVFVAVARIAVYPAIELVPLRQTGERLEVLLVKRRQDDLVWPGAYHIPGTVFRPTDNDFSGAIRRLLDDELAGLEAEPILIGTYFSRSKRGTGVGFNYVINIDGDSPAGKFFDINDLPESVDQAQKEIIARAVEVHKTKHSKVEAR